MTWIIQFICACLPLDYGPVIHTPKTQVSVCELTPRRSQVRPPFCGKGLSHCLDLDLVPTPQVTEQLLKTAQSL